MAGDSVKYEYEALDDMVNELMKGHQLLEDVKEVVRQMSAQMIQGVLLGLAGDYLAAAMGEVLARSIHNLAEKYKEMGRDVLDASDMMKHADQQAAKGFN
jgi:uncharacterized protein YukE